MKKLMAILLVFVLAASAMSVMAFAYSDYNEGYYKGKPYQGHLSVTDTYGSASFYYRGTGSLRCEIEITCRDNRGRDAWCGTNGTSVAPNTARAYQAAPYGYAAIKAESDCYINGIWMLGLSAGTGR